MISYWEKSELMQHDLIVIGGGLTGLSIAASIMERFPNRSVTVLERSMLPYGASTRNAGFACFGSLTEFASDVNHMGAEAARELLFNRWIGLQITRKRLGDAAIGFNEYGGYELLDESRDAEVMMEQLNPLVDDFLPGYFSLLPNDESKGLKPKKGQTVVSMRGEGQLNTGKLVRALEAHCNSIGVMIRGGAEVLEINGVPDNFKVQVKDEQRGVLELSARQVVVATNAFAKSLTDEEVVPGRGQVLITEPIENLKFKGNLHIDEGFYYLRNVGNRIMIGGGRNLAMEDETTTEFGLNETIQSAIEKVMHEVVDMPEQTPIAMRWSGVMAFGKTKAPIVRRLEDGKILAVKMSGMGIALSAQVGELVTDLIEEHDG